MKHGDGTAYVESAHHDGRALRFEFQRNLPSPWKHVGLNSHEADDNSGVGSGMFFHDPQGVHSAPHGSFVEMRLPGSEARKAPKRQKRLQSMTTWPLVCYTGELPYRIG